LNVPESLAAATAAYSQAFGHAVPLDVVESFAYRPGPLMMEIRQAVALKKPVPAWLARSRMSNAAVNAEGPAPRPLTRPAPVRNSAEQALTAVPNLRS
jgi:hypothetical protein